MPAEDMTISPSAMRTMKAFLKLIALAEPTIFELWRSQEFTLIRFLCLRALERGPQPAGPLAKELGIAAPSLTRLLDHLAARGLIDRCIDEEDRRRIVVSITDSGREVLRGPKFWYKSPFPDAFESLSDEDRETLTRLLNTVVEHIKDATPVDDEGGPAHDA